MQVVEAVDGVVGPALTDSKGAHAWAGKGRGVIERMQRRKQAGGLERVTTIGVPYQGSVDLAFGEHGAANHLRGVVRRLGVEHPRSDDLAAVDIQDRHWVVERAFERSRQSRVTPGPLSHPECRRESGRPRTKPRLRARPSSAHSLPRHTPRHVTCTRSVPKFLPAWPRPAASLSAAPATWRPAPTGVPRCSHDAVRYTPYCS